VHGFEGGTAVTCDFMQALLEPCFDGELDANRQAQVLEHIAGCDSCRDEYRRLERLRADLREGGFSYSAPEILRQRVLTTVRAGRKPAVVWPWKGMAIAASALLMLSIGTNIVLTRSFHPKEQTIAREVVSDHVRALMGDRVMDVVSTDQHTVKPWFAGKLDFSPQVKDPAAQGFPLAGGRVDYVDGRPVAALVFRRDAHWITLFTWPADGSVSAAPSLNGYNVVGWTNGGMVFWAVSDLNRADLESFAALYKK
jgi:anti-sigma factor RsiW